MLSNNQPFREGDTVRLRFGRQLMTVLEIDGDGANCVSKEASRGQMVWVAWPCLVAAEKQRKFKLLKMVKAVAGFN